MKEKILSTGEKSMQFKKIYRGCFIVGMTVMLCCSCGKDELKEHYEQGGTYLEEGKYDEAIKEFDQAFNDAGDSKASKNNKKVYRSQAIAYYKKGDYKKAVSLFQYALDIDELSEIDLDILKYKVLADQKMGDYELAIEDFDKAIALDKENFELYFGKYFAQVKIEDTAGASATLEAAREISGKGDEYKFNLSKVYYYMEQYDVAIAGFKEAINNGIKDAYYFLGDAYYKSGEYDKAIECFKKLLGEETTQDLGLVYNQYGNCYMKKENYEKALELFKKGQKIKNTEWMKPLKYNEVVALERLSRFDEALKVCESYLKTYPDDASMSKEKEFLESRITN